VDGALYALVNVSSDGAVARRSATDFAGRIYRQPPERFARYVIAGTPQECVSQLKEFEQSGASTAQLTVAAPPEDHESMLRILAKEVVPAVA
jgi:alkanesulfonate monooxygenase SsuD/methylene tetrahydromethanopterin reductase-like flavin-dependent oxidoreductase (luciferase family)